MKKRKEKNHWLSRYKNLNTIINSHHPRRIISTSRTTTTAAARGKCSEKRKKTVHKGKQNNQPEGKKVLS